MSSSTAQVTWHMLTAFVIVVLQFLDSTRADDSNEPNNICVSQIPDLVWEQPVYTPTPNRVEAPFTIYTMQSTEKYKPGAVITVLIEGEFAGLVLQAHYTQFKDYHYRGEAVGTWESVPNDFYTLNCTHPQLQDTVVYNNPAHNATNMYFKLQTYRDMDKPIKFLATFAHNSSSYWTNVSSTVFLPEGVEADNNKKSILNDPAFTLVAILAIYVGMYTVFSLLLI